MRRFLILFILSLLVILSPVIAHALSADQISQIAKEITVLIDGCGSGSGILYKREGNTDTRTGMSGGAVLNEDGKVIGIHGRADEQNGSKINFGIPIHLLPNFTVTNTPEIAPIKPSCLLPSASCLSLTCNKILLNPRNISTKMLKFTTKLGVLESRFKLRLHP